MPRPVGEARKFPLPGFTTVSISGEDRVDFLQGQLTQDVSRVAADFSPLAGWTTAKGRLLAISPLIAWREAIHLLLPDDIAERVAQRLKMFMLRAKADISTGRYAVAGLTGSSAGSLPIGDTRICAVRCGADLSRAWLIGQADAIATVTEPADVDFDAARYWRLADIRAGVPGIESATTEAFIPQMLNLDLLDAISFTKGCYVGQEIVARTQNLGRIKRRMYRFSSEPDTLPEPGQLLHADTGPTGKVVASAAAGDHNELLAVVPIAEVDAQWFADEAQTQPLTLESLPYHIPA